LNNSLITGQDAVRKIRLNSDKIFFCEFQ